MKPALSRPPTAGIWPLVWPIMLSNLSVPLFGMVDTAALGHLPDPGYLAAVAVGSALLSLLLWSFGFLRMGTTSLVSRAAGAGEHGASVGLWLQAVVLALALAGLLLALQFVLIPLGLYWMGPEPGVTDLASRYCHIRLLSAPATLINYTLIGWFVGQQDTRRPLVMVASANLLNILLDLLLILGLGLNSDGAAWATVIAEYACLALGLRLMRQKLKQLALTPGKVFGLRDSWQRLWVWRDYLPLLRVNRHLFVRTLCLLGVFVCFTAAGARAGTVILAANAVLMQFVMLTAHGLDGFAHAAEALCGKAIGGRNLAEFHRTSRATTRLAILTALAVSAVFWMGKPVWLGIFSEIPEVLTQASADYIWVILLPLASVLAYQLDGIFLGSGQTHTMQNTMLACVFMVFLPLLWATQPLGNSGLWLSFTLFNLARGFTLGAIWRYNNQQQRWLRATDYKNIHGA